MTSSRFSELLSLHKDSKVFIISKTTCWFAQKVQKLFRNCLGVEPDVLNLDEKYNDDEIKQFQSEMHSHIQARTTPQIFIDNKYIGDCEKLCTMYDRGILHEMFGKKKQDFDYRLVIIGGGSGGISSIKTASKLLPDSKFAVFDFVSPTPNILQTTWDIGGTCVNVGCIPKKLFHRSAILDERSKHMEFFKVDPQRTLQNWEDLRSNINNYIRSLNFETTSSLMTAGNIDYINAKARIVEPHKIEYFQDGVRKELTAQDIIIATGTRPSVPPNLAHISDHLITSDDIFWCPYEPRKTLVVGGGYVALECASFLASFGYQVTVVVRQIALRGFDQECVQKILEGMRNIGIKILLDTVIDDSKLLKPADVDAKTPGEFSVRFVNKKDANKNSSDNFNTILVATGRKVNFDSVFNSKSIDISTDPNSGKIISFSDATNFPNIYAIGDVLQGKPELTPVAIAAGKRLVKRILLPEDPKQYVDYNNVATTIFTSNEYSTLGYSEERAQEEYGEENVLVYTSDKIFSTKYSSNLKFAKLVVKRSDNMVLGLHLIGSESGETIQAFSLLMHHGMRAESLLDSPFFIWREKSNFYSPDTSPIENSKKVNVFSI